MPLAGRPMVEWSIAAFRQAGVAAIVVACPPGMSGEFDPELTLVDGGETRAASVSNALAAVETELVAIHDAARPLLTAGLIETVVGALAADHEAAGAIAAAPVADTIKRGTESIDETVDREGLWAAQTPQVFRTDALRAALAQAPDGFLATDEAMLVEAAGGRVLIRASGEPNLKVTEPVDLAVAERLLADRRPG